MRIGILTHYNVNNQGAQLQMYALAKFLKKKGHQVSILTYNKNFDFIPDEGKKNIISLRSVPYLLKNYLFAKGIGLTWHNTLKYKCLEQFRNREFEFVPYHTADIDAVVIGSDEVYSIDVGINPVMYGHGLICDKKISYAPAFGRSTSQLLKEEGCYPLVQSGLQHMSYLSARDLHTQEMVKEMTGKTVPIVCDPVFFMDFSNIKNQNKLKKDYLVVYSYDAHMRTEDEYRVIQLFAQKHNLLTVSVGTYHKWCDKNIVCDPLEWISYFKGAKYVITDTFHGYVTALKSHKKVAVYVRNVINGYKLKSLMKQTGTEDREFSKFDLHELESILIKDMNYKKIDSAMQQMVAAGECYLTDALRMD